MNFKDMLAKMSQLSEATEKTKTGVKHTGSYGKDYETDEEGNEKKKATSDEKKGRGRPKKDDEEGAKFDSSALSNVMGGKKPSKEVGTASKKNTLKDWFERLDTAINEGETTKTKTGLTHKGTYGNSYETDEEGNEKSAEKKGRGRPSKDAGDTKFDTSNLNKAMSGKLKEAEQIQIKPASQVPQKPGQTSLGAKPAVPGQPQQVAGQAQKNTQVIQQGDKTLGTVDNPQLAQQIKQSIGKGEMTLMPEGEMEEGILDTVKKVGGKVLDKLGHGSDEDLIRDLQKKAGVPQTGKKPVAPQNEGKDEGKPGKNFAKIAKSAAKEYGSKEAGERVAGAVRAKLMKQGKIKEAEIPVHDGDMGAGLGAGRSQGMLEGKAKPDFLDMDKDGNKKESMKKAVADKKKTKVKEGMDSRMKAAHHLGKAHALSKEAYNCKFDDLEEARMYHEGFKEGLDECHGQMPIQGYVGENDTVVDDMASFGAHTPELDEMEFDEGNAFTKKLATTPAGGSFTLGGKKFTDNSGYDSSVFESWDNQLNSLLTEYNTIQEGLTVSISKGQQGAPDSVSVNAQDGEAEQLLQFIKQAGLGIFGGEEQPQVGQSSPMSVATDSEPETAEIGVVGDHDGMMDLIKKVTGGDTHAGPEHGFGDEEDHDHEHTDEETCNECGMMECGCNEGEEGHEQVDEVESEDQMEYEVAEDNAPDSGAEDTAIEVADDQEANAAGAAYDAAEDEKQVEEGYANGADDTFESDIDFMTKVISGGLNKQKSTGQTTIPVVASQLNRTVSESKMINESVDDWKKLAGIK